MGKKVDSIVKKARTFENDRPRTIYVCALYMPESMEIRFCLAGDLAQMKSFNVPVADHYDLREAGITGFADLRELVHHPRIGKTRVLKMTVIQCDTEDLEIRC